MSFYPNKKTNWTPEPSFSEGGLTWEQGACRAHQWRSKEVILEFELWSNPAGWNKPRENTNMPTEPRGLGKAPRSRGAPQEGRHQDGENSRDFPGGARPADTPALDFWPSSCETTHFSCFNLPNLWCFVTAAPGTAQKMCISPSKLTKNLTVIYQWNSMGYGLILQYKNWGIKWYKTDRILVTVTSIKY